jgi:hypothetical protein
VRITYIRLLNTLIITSSIQEGNAENTHHSTQQYHVIETSHARGQEKVV